MTFRALVSTDDGRLTEGQIYQGQFVWIGASSGNDYATAKGLRIIVWDNKNEWMTFNIQVFAPT